MKTDLSFAVLLEQKLNDAENKIREFKKIREDQKRLVNLVIKTKKLCISGDQKRLVNLVNKTNKLLSIGNWNFMNFFLSGYL